MSQPQSPLQHAQLSFNQQGTPVAESFDDVYFSNDDGLAETQYVFIQNNGLPDKWQQWTTEQFVIGETGFGTGLNFLAAWQSFLNTEHKTVKQLHFISFEKYPIDKQQLALALESWPQLAPLSEQLLAQYPLPVCGCHRLSFADVTLDLWFGDVNQLLPRVEDQQTGIVDSWFLDGFAPSKNPEMWSEVLFSNLARLSKQNASFATFTAAGMVKRGLIEAGFEVSKVKGFGRKREMLRGVIPEVNRAPSKQAPYIRSGDKKSHSITIIGGGLAAANLALSLAKKGRTITLLCKDSELAQGASGNLMGGFYPLLHAVHDTASQIYTQSFIFAHNQYQQLHNAGFEFDHQWCGALQVSHSEQLLKRQQKIAGNDHFPDELVHAVTQQQASEIAGLEIPYPALYYPCSGWINPPSLVKALIHAAKQHANVTIEYQQKVTSLRQLERDWQVTTERQVYHSDVVVLANGDQISSLLPQVLPFSPVRGQVSISEQPTALSELQVLLCYKGYATPSFQGRQCFGSSFVKNSQQLDVTEQEQQHNLDLIQECFPQQQWSQSLVTASGARASIRCTTPDHLPLVGAMPDLTEQQLQFSQWFKGKPSKTLPKDYRGLYLLSGLGSRGLCSAPLMAEILAAQICEQPLPLSSELLAALNPNRFTIRQLSKSSGKTTLR